jgi:hypothetical protein
LGKGNDNDSNNSSYNNSNNKNSNDDEQFSFDGIIQGGAMSAPVREVAARVMAFLLSISPCNTIQQHTYQVLVQLVNYEKEWEVRHGAMLAFKHVAELVRRQEQGLGRQGLLGDHSHGSDYDRDSDQIIDDSNNYQYMD